jgi:hypothetical protein
MEDQSRFDLNGALATWRAQLASQPTLTGEDLRELQTHLLELFAAGCGRGLTQPAAFANAVSQLGSPEEIGAEFAKAHPLRTWPNRVFVMALAGLIGWAWDQAGSVLPAAAQLRPGSTLFESLVAGALLNGVLPVALLLGIAYGRLAGLRRGLASICLNRWRLLASTATFAVAGALAATLVMWYHPRPDLIFGPGAREQLTPAGLFWNYLRGFPAWPGPYLLLAIWLLPRGRAALNGHPRELLLWCCLGWLAWSAYERLNGVVFSLFPEWALYLLPEWLQMSRYSLSVVSGLFLSLLAVLVAQGRFGHAASWLSSHLTNRLRITAAGLLLVAVSYGGWLASLGQLPGGHLHLRLLFLVSTAFWPLLQVASIAWLARPCPHHLSSFASRRNGQIEV